MRLMAGFGGVDSAAPSYAMWELSRKVRNSRELTGLFERGVSGLTKAVRSSADPGVLAFSRDLDEFLAEFGSRGPNEWDIISETWETNPDIALAAIDRMRLAPDSGSPMANNSARETERKQLEAEILGILAGDEATAGQFKAACSSAQAYVPGRERSKTNIIRVIEETRLAIWEIGRRAVARGEIAKPSDICFLFEDELRNLVDGKLAGITAIIDERKRHYDWLYSLEPPFIINGQPSVNTSWPKRADAVHTRVDSGAVLQGVPGCPGTATGRARVVLTPADPTVLEPGDILVAPMTDPAWTPLFVPAAGVVVDVGAALSHAIIVSRELGIPCAVSVTGASKRIPNGALIEVNGDTGTVTILELP
jgi:pyruvate,water dikinase